MNPFDFVNSITHTKKDLMAEQDCESLYVPFVVNKALSYFPDTILYANEANRLAVDKKLEFHYLLNSIRPAKRFAKWVKRDNIEDIEVVKQYYGFNTEKALQALNILTRDHLHTIKQKLQRGGNNDENRNVS